MLRKLLTILMAIVLVFSLTGCILPVRNPGAGPADDSSQGGESSPGGGGIVAEITDTGGPDTSIALYPGYAELAVGSSLPLHAAAVPEDPGAAYVWESSDDQVAAADQNGVVTGKSEGEAVITVSLRQDPAVTAACTVSVKGDGPTYIFVIPPSDPPADPPVNPNEPGGGEPDAGDAPDEGGGAQADENIPVEYDDTLPVEVIPSIDEFIWTIKIDDVFDWQTQQSGIVLHVLNRLKLTAVKVGGKTPYGEYRCEAALDVDYPEGDIDAYYSRPDSIVNTQFSPLFTMEPFVITVMPMDVNKLFPGSDDPVFKSVIRANYKSMAFGELTQNLSGSTAVTITDPDNVVSGTQSHSGVAVFPYKLRITKDGVVIFSYETEATQNNVYSFKGKLYKTPIIPK